MILVICNFKVLSMKGWRRCLDVEVAKEMQMGWMLVSYFRDIWKLGIFILNFQIRFYIYEFRGLGKKLKENRSFLRKRSMEKEEERMKGSFLEK